LIPDIINVDVSERKLGDTITVPDLNLDKQINVSEKEDTMYGTIINLKIQSADKEDTEIVNKN